MDKVKVKSLRALVKVMKILDQRIRTFQFLRCQRILQITNKNQILILLQNMISRKQ